MPLASSWPSCQLFNPQIPKIPKLTAGVFGRAASRCAPATVVSILAVLLLLGCATSVVADEADDEPRSSTEIQLGIMDAAVQDTFALTWLEELCDSIGPRLTGSPAMDSAIEYAVSTMQSAGFDRVWTEPVMVPQWVRGNEWAKMTAPVTQEIAISGLGGSIGTPPQGIEAEVLVVSDEAELARNADQAKGKIVLFDPPWDGYGSVVKYRGNGASMAARYGAVAALVRSATKVSLNTPHTGIMQYQEGVAKIPAAAVTVEDAARMHRLAGRGVPIRVRLVMEAKSLGEREQANVIGELRGRDLADEIVLIGAHLDSWDLGTGAHDDGAGCAIMVGAVRLLHALELRPRRTIRVVLFVAEEQGGHGGRAYHQAHAAELDRHVAALESDSGAFAPDGFTVRADDAVIERIGELAEPLAALGAGHVRRGWAGVDIGPIVEAGVIGIGHRVQGEHYFDYHHSPADTFDKIVAEDLAANVGAAAALTWAIAEYGL